MSYDPQRKEARDGGPVTFRNDVFNNPAQAIEQLVFLAFICFRPGS
jgi:hypothetical protein